MTHDPVNHPTHYTSDPSGVECITITRHRNFNVGNAIKYLWRAGLKDNAPVSQDLEKAIWYLRDEITRLEGVKTAVEALKLPVVMPPHPLSVCCDNCLHDDDQDGDACRECIRLAGGTSGVYPGFKSAAAWGGGAAEERPVELVAQGLAKDGPWPKPVTVTAVGDPPYVIRPENVVQGEPVTRLCMTCKHEDRDTDTLPCMGCHGSRKRPGWEAKS